MIESGNSRSIWGSNSSRAASLRVVRDLQAVGQPEDRVDARIQHGRDPPVCNHAVAQAGGTPEVAALQARHGSPDAGRDPTTRSP